MGRRSPHCPRRARRGDVRPVEPSSAPWRVLETTEPAPPEPGPASRSLPWPAIAAAIVAVFVAVAAILVTARPEPVIGIDGAADLRAGAAGPGGTRSADPASSPPDLVVAVSGAVQRPGVYRLHAGARVGDAIGAAGGYGATVDADLVDRQLNLAAVVSDGEKIRVPVRGETGVVEGGGAGTVVSGGAPVAGGPVDLNRASAEALDTLPGVGPVTVAKIIAAREEQPFAGVDDLLARKIVGAATLEKIRPLATAVP